MADMRLIVAGAGGRMGRALTRVIAETPGAMLAGALEAPGSEFLGEDREKFPPADAAAAPRAKGGTR